MKMFKMLTARHMEITAMNKALTASCILFILLATTASAHNNASQNSNKSYKLKVGVDYCWSYMNYTLNNTGTVRLTFIDVGNKKNYLVSGLIKAQSLTSTLELKRPLFGNAELVDGSLMITTTLAGIRNGVIGADVRLTTLDPFTLNGTFEQFGGYFDAVEISEGEYWKIDCEDSGE